MKSKILFIQSTESLIRRRKAGAVGDGSFGRGWASCKMLPIALLDSERAVLLGRFNVKDLTVIQGRNEMDGHSQALRPLFEVLLALPDAARPSCTPVTE